MALMSVLPDTLFFPVSHHATALYTYLSFMMGKNGPFEATVTKYPASAKFLNKKKKMLTFLDPCHNCQVLTGLLIF
jgi:hypothetical protein